MRWQEGATTRMPYVTNEGLRYMLIGYARVSKAASPGRNGAARHLRVRTLHAIRHQTRKPLQVRPAARPVARAGPEGTRHLNRAVSC